MKSAEIFYICKRFADPIMSYTTEFKALNKSCFKLKMNAGCLSRPPPTHPPTHPPLQIRCMLCPLRKFALFIWLQFYVSLTKHKNTRTVKCSFSAPARSTSLNQGDTEELCIRHKLDRTPHTRFTIDLYSNHCCTNGGHCQHTRVHLVTVEW